MKCHLDASSIIIHGWAVHGHEAFAEFRNYHLKKKRRRGRSRKNHAIIGPMKLVFGILRSNLINTCTNAHYAARPTLNDSSRKYQHCVGLALECTLRRVSQTSSSWFNANDYFCRSFNRLYVCHGSYGRLLSRSYVRSLHHHFRNQNVFASSFLFCCLFIAFVYS